MKKLLLLFVTIIACSFSLSAQWTSGGTQLTSSAAYDHRMFTSATTDGGFYITWIAADTSVNEIGSIKLGAYDSTGALRSGWVAGGVTLSPVGDHYGPQIISSEDDGAIVAWYGYAGSNSYSQIYIQKYSLAGQALWNGGNALQVTTGTIYNYKYPIIISDKKKGVFVASTRYDLNIDFSSPDILLQHIDSAGNVASAWPTDGILAAGSANREIYPQLALTKDQAFIYMGYASYPDSTHLVLNKFNTSDGSLASGWSSSGVNITKGSVVNPRVNCNFWVFTDTIGNASLLWLDSRLPTANWELYMSQVGANSTIKIGGIYGQFIAGGPKYGNGIDYLEVKQDKEYNLLVSFNDRNTVDPNATSTIDAYKITPNLNVLWHKNNIVSYDYSYCPKAVTDGHKGMFIFYEDVNTYHLHGIALDSTGNLYSGWAAGGADFGAFIDPDGFNPDYDFSAVAVKPGRAVVAWNKYGSFGYLHLYDCNLNSNGSFCGNNIFTDVEQVKMNGANCIIYPNPMEDYATIMINEKLTNESNMTLSLFDLSGKEVKQFQLNSSAENSINTSHLAQGMYFYRLVSNNEVIQNGKLIKQ